MKVKYIYSACIEVECNGFRILTDPWFTDGAYDGTWYQYPKINPFDFISKPDLIYISHIHPDHYDAIFLKKLIAKYGEIPILIPDLNPNYLLFKGKSDGLNLIPTRHFKNDKVELFIEENDTGSISDIDSALVVRDLDSNKLLLNLNDCIYNQPHVDKLKSIIDEFGGKIDLLALGYTGAGPYPQTYIDIEEDKTLLISEADSKKINFFERYKKYCHVFNSSYHLPFAGEYILGGKLHYLNNYRGVADAYEVKDFDEKAIILQNGGYIDLVSNEITNQRNSLYSMEDLDRRLESIKDNLYDYEKEISIPLNKINFMRLLNQAFAKACMKSELKDEYNFIISIKDEFGVIKQRFDLNPSEKTVNQLNVNDKISHKVYSEIKIDYRYLYGLLTTIYHWNNAEVGSHYFTERVPLDSFNPKAQSFLNFLAIA